MELLSALSLGELALSFSRVPLFPVFDLSYFIVSILYLKYEPGEPEQGFGGGWHRGARMGGGGARIRKPWIIGETAPGDGFRRADRQVLGSWGSPVRGWAGGRNVRESKK